MIEEWRDRMRRDLIFMEFSIRVIGRGYSQKDAFLNNEVFSRQLDSYINQLTPVLREEYRQIIIEEKNKWIEEKLKPKEMEQ